MVLMIWSRIPWTIEAIAITVATPITTPRIVSAERSLLARSWSRAMSQPSETECSFTAPNPKPWGVGSGTRRCSTDSRCAPSRTTPHSPRRCSLVPQRHHRIQARGPHGRIHAEYHTDARAQAERDDDRPGRDARGQRRHDVHELGERRAREHAEYPAQHGEGDRFREELVADVAASRAERLADADLPGALVHAHQHDVHDHDAPDDDPDGHHGRDHREEEAREVLPEAHERVGGIDGEVVRLARAQAVRDEHRLLGALHAVLHERRLDRKSV